MTISCFKKKKLQKKNISIFLQRILRCITTVHRSLRARYTNRRAPPLIPESTSNKWHSFPGNEAKCNAAKMDGRHLCILGIVDLAQQGPIKRTIKRRLTPRAAPRTAKNHLLPSPHPLPWILDNPPRTSPQDFESEARRSLADLKDFVNGVTLPRCYGVVTAGRRGRSTTTEEILAPIDPPDLAFRGISPVDEMHFISTLQRTRIRMAVNYFSPYVSANAKLCEGEEDFEDTRTNVSVILLSSRPRRHLILSFCFGISLCFVI